MIDTVSTTETSYLEVDNTLVPGKNYEYYIIAAAGPYTSPPTQKVIGEY